MAISALARKVFFQFYRFCGRMLCLLAICTRVLSFCRLDKLTKHVRNDYDKFEYNNPEFKKLYESEQKIAKWVKSRFLMIVPIYAKVSIFIHHSSNSKIKEKNKGSYRVFE
jgi:hypothetical protein